MTFIIVDKDLFKVNLSITDTIKKITFFIKLNQNIHSISINDIKVRIIKIELE